MEQMFYERPREKLRNQGAASLSIAELLQLVIGAGNVRSSGAQLARKVEHSLAGHPLTYENLISFKGVGEAKACQIIAALELGSRGVRHEG